MNQACIITSKSEKLNFDNIKEKVLYIEDYVQFYNIAEARKLTDKIFSHNADFIAEYDYKGYKITWSWYSDVFQLCVKYLEIKTLIDKIERLNIHKISIGEVDPQYKKVLNIYFYNKSVTSRATSSKLWSNLKQILFNFTIFSFSVFSIMFFILRPGRSIGTYTSDFVYKDNKSDIRFSYLYKKYQENSIQYVEFIRPTTIKNFFINTFKRRRFAIYYTSIIYFVDLFTKKTEYSKKPQNYYQSILYRYHGANISLKKSVLIIEKIYKILRIHKFVLIFFNSRNAHLAIAAKSLSIKTIGIMHGLQQKDYAVYEFMESYHENKKIGCDVYGVWSNYYLEYFQKHSKISNANSFQYSGLLRPVKNINQNNYFCRVSEDKIKVLLVSEPLVSVFEVIPYIKCLLKNNNIEVAIKVRPMIRDSYYENLKSELPYINNLDVISGDIHEVGNNFDVFVGSYSTAVIEASLIGKISVLLDTKRWGDYFDIDTLIPNKTLLVKRPEALNNHIFSRIENEQYLNTIELTKIRFFGDNRDGAQWVVDQL